ncbi:hypothetical protein GEV33_006465 [Tenebrio molitor]|uniref:Uncharacterized protein n=1 Tax=Tenebrio molitor TaxID=7067 RepID=A0A8J6HLS0_TENMO|nr:hypothetical protein GEV33_006465 [Tenebrio molitor]
MDGSSFSSPLESPDAPITSSVATLQSAESLSFRRQVRLCSGHCSEPVDNSCLPAQIHSPLRRQPSLPTQTSLTKTPDTPSANISSQSSSEHSQAFTSHFTSESSLLPKYQLPEEPQSPSAILTPSTEISSDADAHNSEDIDFLKFDEDPWDITNFDYDLSSLNIDGMSTKKMQKQIDALIEHKCKQLSKNNSGKGNAIHLEKWMKGHLDTDIADEAELEPLSEEWTEEMLRKRSQELQLIDAQGNITCRNEPRKIDSRCEDINLSDHDQSPSKSTTTESQVTVRSSPLVPETVPVCRQCHKNCLPPVNNSVKSATKSNNHTEDVTETNCTKDENDNKDDNDDWRPLLLMGLSALNPAASLVKLDPFSTPIPQINVAPPTPESSTKTTSTPDQKIKDSSCNCRSNKPEINSLELSNDVDISPDDSPQTEEHPYHSLSSSNLTLRRFGTVSSLERLGTDEHEDNWEERYSSETDEDQDDQGGIDNEAFYHSSIRSWTAKAGSFVAEKMAFFERLGEDYRNTGKFFERYLKTAEATVNGDDMQEDETSGATSGEEIWGTPTSGGEMDDPLSSPNYEGKQSPYDGSISSDNGDDTELMMDELLMTPPISGAIMRGLLPRRTLEPLIEEDCSESCSLTSSETPTEPSVSPEQGNGTGDVADTCSTAAENQTRIPNAEKRGTGSVGMTSETTVVPKMHRSESYRRIVEAAEEVDDSLGFFNRFKPTVKFINIERVPRAKSVKM